MREIDIPMLTNEEVAAVAKLKEKVKEKFSLRKLILFGSKARADFDDDSDLESGRSVDRAVSSSERGSAI